MQTAAWSAYRGPGRISISRSAPRRAPAGYRLYRKLAPGPWFNSVDDDTYHRLFLAEILAPLDPRQVWAELHALAAPHEPVLLCWEHDPAGCHRRMVAAWLEQALGVRVPELGTDLFA